MNRWKEVECVSESAPPVREDDISNSIIYLRKDFKHIPEQEIGGQVMPAKWVYLETTIPKDVAELLDMTDSNTESIAGLEDALCEMTMGVN